MGTGLLSRCVSSLQALQRKYRPLSDIRVNEVLFSVDATYCHRAHVQSLTNLSVMWWPVAQLLFSRTKKAPNQCGVALRRS